jgi:aldose sugar dehydrogenase
MLTMVVGACDASNTPDQAGAADSASSDTSAIAVDTGAPAFTFETVAESLSVPWAIAFAPDGRIFVTERLGSIRVIRNGVLEREPWATLHVSATGEAGLMGIALAPNFERNPFVYVVATFATTGGLVNRVLRFTERDGKGHDMVMVLDSIPAARFHAGDAIAFGPDGMLYLATGDAMSPASADDTTSLAGKILRMTPEGKAPADNPVPGSLIYATGLRNVQGIAWDHESGQMFATDHGPTGFPNERFRRNHDELNAILPGGDHGWPDVAGHSSSAESVKPLMDWDPAIAPSGLAMYLGTQFPRWHRSLFVGALRGEELRRISVESDSSGWLATSEETIVKGIGRIRAVAMGPDGYLYFTTSNQDGRGTPRPGDDRVLRIIPSNPAP